MLITSLDQAHRVLRSTLLSDWMNNPLYEFDERTPNQVVQGVGVHCIVEHVAMIMSIDLNSPMGELSGRIPSELYRERDGEEKVFWAVMERFSRLLSKSWYEQSMGAFQGRTAKEVLEYEGGEAIVITHIEELAEEQSKG